MNNASWPPVQPQPGSDFSWEPPSPLPSLELHQTHPMLFSLSPSQLCCPVLPYFKRHFLFVHETFQARLTRSLLCTVLYLCASWAVLVPIMPPVFSKPSALLHCLQLLSRALNSVTSGLKPTFWPYSLLLMFPVQRANSGPTRTALRPGELTT